MSVSRAGSMIPFTVNNTNDFDTNTAADCAPSGITFPTIGPILFDVTITGPIPFRLISSGINVRTQTSMVSRIEVSWSFNYSSEVALANLPEMYLNNFCNPAVSGT